MVVFSCFLIICNDEQLKSYLFSVRAHCGWSGNTKNEASWPPFFIYRGGCPTGSSVVIHEMALLCMSKPVT